MEREFYVEIKHAGAKCLVRVDLVRSTEGNAVVSTKVYEDGELIKDIKLTLPEKK